MNSPHNAKSLRTARHMPIRTYSNTPLSDEPQEQTGCIVCGHNNATAHWQLAGYNFVRCRTCGHLYQNPRPTATALDDRYAEEYCQYEIENAEQFFQLMMRGIDDSGVSTLLERTLITNAVATAPTPPAASPNGQHRPALLDIGCATGMLLAHYQRQDWDVQGIELCQPAAEYARITRGVAVMDGDYASARLPAAHYTLIHSSHVIEHVLDPVHFLRFIARTLHPDGYAILVTPDAAGLQARLMGARWRSAIADHLNLFRARHLTELARRAGLELVRKCSWGGLAAGIAPQPIKHIADRTAKRLNIGDVMLLLLRRTPELGVPAP